MRQIKLTALAAILLLTFSCVSGGERRGEKSVEQLSYESELLGAVISDFFEEYSPFNDEDLEDIMLKRRFKDSYTVNGPEGGKALIKVKSESIPRLPNWYFTLDYLAKFKDYNYHDLIINSNNFNIRADMEMLISDNGENISGTLLVTFSGTIDYTGAATGRALFRVAAEGSMADNFDSFETKELYFSIDGIELETENMDIFGEDEDVQI